jgi:transglutaminase-like putative cysteine protease
MNVPARYCTGYLGDIGVPPDDVPMDFSAWFEVYLGGRWYTFDARHNKAAHRPDPDGARARRHRRRYRDLVRPVHARGFQGDHRRGHIGWSCEFVTNSLLLPR